MDKDLSLLFRYLTHGVYVIGVSHKGENNAFTAAWIMQASFEPLLLALSINPDHSSYGLLIEGKKFSVSVLPRERLDLAEYFGQPSYTDKLAGVNWFPCEKGAPVLADAIAYFECEFSHECDAGDHRLVLGRVVNGDVLVSNAIPMSYRDTGDMDRSSRLFPTDFSP